VSTSRSGLGCAPMRHVRAVMICGSADAKRSADAKNACVTSLAGINRRVALATLGTRADCQQDLAVLFEYSSSG
jgi:hypothetical protein